MQKERIFALIVGVQIYTLNCIHNSFFTFCTSNSGCNIFYCRADSNRIGWEDMEKQSGEYSFCSYFQKLKRLFHKLQAAMVSQAIPVKCAGVFGKSVIRFLQYMLFSFMLGWAVCWFWYNVRAGSIASHLEYVPKIIEFTLLICKSLLQHL